MSGKFALIIGNTEYTDPGLAQLTAPGKDTEDFARVLKDREIGAFDDVNILLNQPEPVVRGAIDEFFDQKKPDDLLVLYFSGHGVRDELGALFLAVKNTIRSRLRSTAVKSDYIREVMDQSRSRRQVLILDCCNSGAFSQGTKAATGVSIGTASAFESGFGRIILTASDSTQFAWEGDKVIGETDNSLFTHYLVEGLEGEADLDGDGRITVDELYDYAYEKVKLATPKQTPSKFSSKQQGEIVLRQSMRIEDTKPVPLPTPLLDSIENPFSDVRMGAVQQLIKLLNGKNLGLARSAREALEQIAENDDSRQVSHASVQALESIRQAEQLATQKRDADIRIGEEEEVNRAEMQKAEAQRLVHERATKAERQEKEKAERFAEQKNESVRMTSVPVREERLNLETNGTTSLPSRLALITLGWMISGLFAGFLWSEFDDARGEVIAGIIGGGGGGFITAFILRSEKILSDQISTFRIVLAWAIGGVIGWLIGWVFLSEASGAGIGIAVFAIIGLVGTLGMDYIRVNWKSVAGITAAWWFGGAIGWSLSKGLIDKIGADPATSWAIGTAIGWAIGGYVLGWQLLNTINKAELEIGKAKKKNMTVAESTSRLDTIPISRWRTVFWIATGWAIDFAIVFPVTVFAAESGVWGNDLKIGAPIAFAVIGAIGGLTTAFSLRLEKIFFSWDRIFWITLAWAVGWGIGGAIFIAVDEGILTIGEQTGFPLAVAVAGAIGGFMTAMVLRLEQKLISWKSIFWVTLGWASGCVIGLEISSLNESPGGLLFGWAIGGALGGFVMIWQILKDTSNSPNGSNKEVTKFSKPSQIKLTETQKAFLLSPLGRSLLGVTVGLILGILFGALYGIIKDISYDFAYAYLSFDTDVPHIFLLVICGLAGLIAYPHRWTIPLMIGSFIVVVIAKSQQGFLLYDLLAFGGVYGLPAGALVSRILYWLKIIK